MIGAFSFNLKEVELGIEELVSVTEVKLISLGLKEITLELEIIDFPAYGTAIDFLIFYTQNCIEIKDKENYKKRADYYKNYQEKNPIIKPNQFDNLNHSNQFVEIFYENIIFQLVSFASRMMSLSPVSSCLYSHENSYFTLQMHSLSM